MQQPIFPTLLWFGDTQKSAKFPVLGTKTCCDFQCVRNINMSVFMVFSLTRPIFANFSLSLRTVRSLQNFIGGHDIESCGGGEEGTARQGTGRPSQQAAGDGQADGGGKASGEREKVISPGKHGGFQDHFQDH